MRGFTRSSLVFAALTWLIWTTSGSVRGGIILEDYKKREILGVSTSGKYDPRNDYNVDGKPWVANLYPLHPQELQLGGTTLFLDILEAAFPESKGWSYVTGAQDLSP